MAANSAPPQWQQQGDTLNAFATAQGRPELDFARLLDEQYLRGLPVAHENDTPLGNNPTAPQYRYHARRHMANALSWGCRQEFPDDVNDALYERWYSPRAARTGFRQRR